ncbi:hypothetical protein GCM10020369_72270 [Cryptosporangium minutisporangium]|uniref:Lipoprotein n=1 Tax=Cryptosporangium minutisporangium TaxID=113569 RepID=A0ABP6T8T5_9ACTN
MATAALVGAALAGCGSENDSPAEAEDKPAASASAAAPADKPEGRLLTPADAKAALPTVSEMPGKGWTSTAVSTEESSPTVTPAKCAPVMNELSTDFGGYKPKLAAKEGVKFTNQATGQTELLFEVASWTNEADAGLPLAAAELADDCKSFTATDEGTTLEFTAERLTPLPIGEKQAAVRLTASFQGTKIYLTVFEAKIGHNLISMVQTSPESTDRANEYKPIVESIIADLQKAA